MHYSPANGDILEIWCVMHFVMVMRDCGKIVVIDKAIGSAETVLY